MFLPIVALGFGEDWQLSEADQTKSRGLRTTRHNLFHHPRLTTATHKPSTVSILGGPNFALLDRADHPERGVYVAAEIQASVESIWRFLEEELRHPELRAALTRVRKQGDDEP